MNLEREKNERFSFWAIIVMAALCAFWALSFQRCGAVEPPAFACRVQVPEANGTAFGSGILAGTDNDAGYVLTNNHVVKDRTAEPEVYFTNENHFPGKVVAREATWDLALIRIAKPANIAPPIYAQEHPQRGSTAFAGGFGPNGHWVWTKGPVAGYFAPRQGLPAGGWFETAATSREGDSGGPVFTEDGQLIGIRWGGSRDGSMVVEIGQVVAFEQQCQNGQCGIGLGIQWGQPRQVGRPTYPAPAPLTPVQPPANLTPAPLYTPPANPPAATPAPAQSQPVDLSPIQAGLANLKSDVLAKIDGATLATGGNLANLNAELGKIAPQVIPGVIAAITSPQGQAAVAAAIPAASSLLNLAIPGGGAALGVVLSLLAGKLFTGTTASAGGTATNPTSAAQVPAPASPTGNTTSANVNLAQQVIDAVRQGFAGVSIPAPVVIQSPSATPIQAAPIVAPAQQQVQLQNTVVPSPQISPVWNALLQAEQVLTPQYGNKAVAFDSMMTTIKSAMTQILNGQQAAANMGGWRNDSTLQPL